MQAAERIRVVDIFDEVEDDLRAERTEKLLKKYAWVLIAIVVGVIGAAAGWQLWTRYKNQQDAAAAAQYISLQTVLQQSAPSGPGQRAALDALAASAPEGYKTLARLRAAGLTADAGDLTGAVTLWNAVAADSAADPLLRDLASLLATQRQIDKGDPVLLEARLKPLAELGIRWAPLAEELLAVLDLRQGRVDDARKKLQMLSMLGDAPPGLRTRAAALLAGLGTPAAK